MLHTYLQKLLAREDDAREDKDIEAVHDMRVASRRIRAMLPLVSLVAPLNEVRLLKKGIRTVARTLSSVRDCDVFLEQVYTWAATLTLEQQSSIAILTNALLKDRAVARKRMLKLFQSSHYDMFKYDVAMFITGDMAQWNTRVRLCDCMGSMILQRYEQLRGFETIIHIADATIDDSETLHDMRIVGKQLRYLLDITAALDTSSYTTNVLEPLVALQDCLGTIQDIAVAMAYVAALQEGSDAEHAVLQAYCAARDAERQAQVAQLPTLWKTLMSKMYRRNLMEVIIRL
jgi:CHAD domain-containing protein